MLGREKVCSPVFIWRQAPLWLILSATIERMTQISSMHDATFGNSSLTSMPASPYFLNLKGDWSRLPVRVRSRWGMANGSGLPLSRASRVLGSNVSTCDGPPDMNRKMTCFAFGGKCGGRTESGLSPDPPARTSSAKRQLRPSIAKPLAKRWRNSRRLLIRNSVQSLKCIEALQEESTVGREDSKMTKHWKILERNAAILFVAFWCLEPKSQFGFTL